MNHAERVKELSQKLAEAHSFYCNANDGEDEAAALKWKHEAEAELHAEIDAMQSALDGAAKQRDELAAMVPELRGKCDRMRLILAARDAEVERLTRRVASTVFGLERIYKTCGEGSSEYRTMALEALAADERLDAALPEEVKGGE